MREEQARLLADGELTGAAWCQRHVELVDRWLGELFTKAATPADGDTDGLALLAVGGYGRGDLAPQSDIDVVLVHDGRADIATVADALWYPIWDEGLRLGHSVRTPAEALKLATSDLDTGTSLLTVRHVAGDRALGELVAGQAMAQWRRGSRRWLRTLHRGVRKRHASAGEVAFLLEPDLKEGRGGLRDVHALGWAAATGAELPDHGDDARVAAAHDLLLSVRVELHRRTRRRGDRLGLEDQPAVATALGHASTDELMAEVAGAARVISWHSDSAWRGLDPEGRRRMPWVPPRPLGSGIVLRQGQVHLTGDADLSDPTLVLRTAVATARAGTRTHHASLQRLATTPAVVPVPWPAPLRAAFVDLLRAGAAAIPVIEDLDALGLWELLLPEWPRVRSRPQRNPYHRFTVDRHLVEAAVGAGALAHRVARPDLLVVGGLLHDIGKGWPGDHTTVGVDVVGRIAPRMGFDQDETTTLVDLVRHHLLLPDVATRRDLDDPETIRTVARAVGDRDRLALLAALTEADGIATGAAAWGPWKASLVHALVERVDHVLGGGDAEDVTEDFPTRAQLDVVRAGRQVVEGAGDHLTVVTRDRSGLFGRVTAVLALHGILVRDAALATVDGMALEVFHVEPERGDRVDWDALAADLELALAGRLALQARIDERARLYASQRVASPEPVVPRVTIDQEGSQGATVVEVHAPGSIDVHHRLARALSDMDLDIIFAKVQTLGPEVVDAFYLRDVDGDRLTDPSMLAEVERALLHACQGLA